MLSKERPIDTIANSLHIPSIEEADTHRRLVVDGLSRKGIIVNPTTISRLRSRDTSGTQIARRVRAENLLETGMSDAKDKFYLEIAQYGQELNQLTAFPGARKLLNTGFTEAIAEGLKVNSQSLRRCLRAMRVDMVLTELSDPDFNLQEHFYHTTETYFDSYVNGKNPSPSITKLSNEWSRKTIGGFYRDYYRCLTLPTVMRTWSPYEVNIFGEFYKWRISKDSPLSLYDKLVLNSDIENRPEGLFETRIEDILGIKYSPSVTYDHLRVLINGEV